MNGRVLRTAMLASGAALTAGAAAGVLRKPSAQWPQAPGEQIDLGDGERVHVLSNGQGSGCTVVFESALSCPCTEWGWVLSALDGNTPYLAYDRPGNGWSHSRRRLDTAADYNSLTLRLLRQLELPAPYLLVGHSVGGLLVRTFAATYPELTAGLVLVDSSHPDQLQRSAIQREAMSMTRQGIAMMWLRTRFGLLRKDDEEFGALAALPIPSAQVSAQIMRRPEPWAAARREFTLWSTRWAAAVRAGSAPHGKPVAVVTAGRQVAGDVAHGRMQAELAMLSTISRHDVVEDAEHDSLVMDKTNAEHVTTAVRWALTVQPEKEELG